MWLTLNIIDALRILFEVFKRLEIARLFIWRGDLQRSLARLRNEFVSRVILTSLFHVRFAIVSTRSTAFPCLWMILESQKCDRWCTLDEIRMIPLCATINPSSSANPCPRVMHRPVTSRQSFVVEYRGEVCKTLVRLYPVLAWEAAGGSVCWTVRVCVYVCVYECVRMQVHLSLLITPGNRWKTAACLWPLSVLSLMHS